MKSSIWNKPEYLLLGLVFVMAFCFSTWQVLLNNFVIEKAAFTGVEIGILQSVREIPGFLAFSVVFVLLIIKEQHLAFISLLVMSLGVALTGFLPFEYGLYFTTLVMSVGFHYFETINKSLTLQWLPKEKTPHFMGRALSVKSVGALLAYGLVWVLMGAMGVEFLWVYLGIGLFGFLVVLVLWNRFNHFPEKHAQKKRLILRKRYWLYYVLTFLSGARRQIFVVFAGFMMVEKFGYSVAEISTLFIVNYIFNFLFAAKIGKVIGKIGERNALTIEYCGLIMIFAGYAVVSNEYVAAGLYIADHIFFSFAIAISTYFQKIADKDDIAATASVSFTINHIAAVVIPALLGLVWVVSHAAVFYVGVVFACLSLLFTFNIPRHPDASLAVNWGRVH